MEFTLEQIKSINGITEEQVKVAEKKLRGYKVLNKKLVKEGKAERNVVIEADNEEALLAMLVGKEKKESNIETKQGFNSALVTAAKNAIKNGVEKEAILNAINELYKEKANKAIEDKIAKLKAQMEALEAKKV